MAIVLSCILTGEESYRIHKEQELRSTYPSIWAIDPDKILEAGGDYSPKTYQGRENITDEVLSLHSRLEQLVGLLANSPRFGETLGQNQVLGIGSLKDALNTFPKEPISLSLLDVEPPGELPPLLLLGEVMHSDVYGLPVVGVELCPAPGWSPLATLDNLDIFLREARIGERGKPVFYTSSVMPSGTGRLETEAYRAGPSPVFFLLAYKPSKEFQINKAAVEAFDEFLGRLDIKTGEISFLNLP